MNHLEHEDGSPRRIASHTVWEVVRQEIQESFQMVAGKFPSDKCELDIEVVEEIVSWERQRVGEGPDMPDLPWPSSMVHTFLQK